MKRLEGKLTEEQGDEEDCILASGGAGGPGIGRGMVVTAMATSDAVSDRPIDRAVGRFMMPIGEVAQNFVFGESLQGEYRRQVTMQDQSVRDIGLTSTLKGGGLVVRFDDTGRHLFVGSNGSTAHGRLLAQMHDLDQVDAVTARLQASDERK